MKATHYDVIAQDGSYRQGVSSRELTRYNRGTPALTIKRVLPLRGIYRWPLLGAICRNMWAKRHGAILFPINSGRK